MNYRVKTNFDRGYVNAMDTVRVFIESNQKVMFVNTDEYKNAKNARAAYGTRTEGSCTFSGIRLYRAVSLSEEATDQTVRIYPLSDPTGA